MAAVVYSPPNAEAFTGVPGPLSSPWAQQRTSSTGTLNRNGVGSGIGSTDGLDLSAYWIANTFSNDQYSQVRIAGGLAANSAFAQAAVRASGNSDATYNKYTCYTDGTPGPWHTGIAKVINGTLISLAGISTTFTTNDVIKVSAVGTTISCFKNGVVVGTITDSSLPSGSPGVGVYGNRATIDDWEGGSVVAGPVPVATVVVSPASASVVVGATQQLSATTKDASNNVLTGRTVAWVSSNAAAATVDANGLVTAVGVGATTITATSEGRSGTSTISVNQPTVAVASVSVSPASATLVAGGPTQQLTATPKDASDNALSDRSIAWSSSNSAVATVNASGLVTGVAPGGPVTISATSEGQSGTAAVTVIPAAVASVTISPSLVTVGAGGMQPLTATLRDANNNVLTGRIIAWSSDAPSVARVDPTSGVVTGVSFGSARITASSEGQTGISTVTVASVTGPPGPLRVSTDNRRYFADPSGRVVYLTGSEYWKTIQDNSPSNPPQAFDYSAFLSFLQSHNHNFTRLYMWEQARYSAETSLSHWFSPTLYVRTGPGIAADGGPKFDLNQVNPAYLARVRQRVIDAGTRGIYVSVMFFDGWSVGVKGGSTAGNPWVAHPFNSANNINGVNGDPNGDGRGAETQTLSIPAVTAIQTAYVKAVIDAVNDLDNVIYEISNESDQSSVAWQYSMIDLVRSYEAGKPKRHPVGMTVPYPTQPLWSNTDVLNSTADWVSMNGDISNPAVATGNKVSLWDTDHLCGICGDVPWVWKSLTRGHNLLFMDGYDGSLGVGDPTYNPGDPIWEAIRKNMGYARSYAARMDLARAVPHGELAESGYCLAKPGSEYLVYSPGGTSLSVNLSAVPSTVTLTVEWFNTSTGAATVVGTVAGGAIRRLRPPATGASVVFVH